MFGSIRSLNRSAHMGDVMISLTARNMNVIQVILDHLDHLDHLDPNLLLWYVEQDLHRTDPTQETCARSCRLDDSHRTTWARSYRSGFYLPWNIQIVHCSGDRDLSDAWNTFIQHGLYHFQLQLTRLVKSTTFLTKYLTLVTAVSALDWPPPILKLVYKCQNRPWHAYWWHMKGKIRYVGDRGLTPWLTAPSPKLLIVYEPFNCCKNEPTLTSSSLSPKT